MATVKKNSTAAKSASVPKSGSATVKATAKKKADVAPRAAAAKKATVMAKAEGPKKAAHSARAAVPKLAARAAKAAAPKKAAAKAAPPGYTIAQNSALLIPQKAAAKATKPSTGASVVIPPSKLQEGIRKAKEEISQAIQTINDVLNANSLDSEIELSVSFNAEGKFLGFGVGGAFSLKIKLERPASEE